MVSAALNLLDRPSHIPYYLLQPMKGDDLQAIEVIYIPDRCGKRSD
jgi:hypothetical protein